MTGTIRFPANSACDCVIEIESTGNNPLTSTDLEPARPLFDEAWYLARYPDIAAARVDPWKHYVRFGARENREPNALFDVAWYRKQYAAALASCGEPLLHYWLHGATGDFDPNPLFRSAWYSEQNREVRASGMNPLLHYLKVGAAQLCDPSPEFQCAWYRKINPDVGPSQALAHYLHRGDIEGRRYTPSRIRNAGAKGNRLRIASKNKIAVYTAIYGNYDALQIPEVIDPACDYYCFTDADIGWQDTWKRSDTVWQHDDPARTVRHIKIHPHLYFPDYEWSVWLDGNLRLQAPVWSLLPSRDADMALYEHPFRDCLYAEAEACSTQGKDDSSTIQAQIERYRNVGYPEHNGLTENNVLVRRHNAPAMVAMAEAWWREICAGSRRDQISLPFVLRDHPIRMTTLTANGISARNDPRLRFFSHIRNTAFPFGSHAESKKL